MTLNSIRETIFHMYDTSTTFVQETIAPTAHSLSSRVQDLFHHMKPFIDATWAFLQTNVGMATTALVSSCILIQLSYENKNHLMKVTLFLAGLGLAMASGMFLTHAGVLPGAL